MKQKKSNTFFTQTSFFIDNGSQLTYPKKQLFNDLVMKKQGIPIILILMMLITPIASAFDHCAGMDMSGHFSEPQSFSVALSADDTSPLDHQEMPKGSHSSQTDIDCHTSGSCIIHICGGCGITSSAPTINIVISSYYSIFEYTSSYSTVLSSDLRPPIFIL